MGIAPYGSAWKHFYPVVPFKPIISYNFSIARVVHFGLGCCLLASRPPESCWWCWWYFASKAGRAPNMLPWNSWKISPSRVYDCLAFLVSHGSTAHIFFDLVCLFFLFRIFPLVSHLRFITVTLAQEVRATYPQCCHNVNVIFSFACIDFWSLVDYECAMWLNQAPVLMWSSTFPPKHVSAGTLLRHFVRICTPQRHSDSAQVTVVAFMLLCFSRTKA